MIKKLSPKNALTNLYEMNSKYLDHDIIFYICDIVCENLPYGGKNMVAPGQTPRNTRHLIRAYHICCSLVQFQPIILSQVCENS